MKKAVLFISILLTGTNNIFSQDTIPNSGFENWTGSSPNQPVGWGTANAISPSLDSCVIQSVLAGEFNSGSSGIVLTTAEISAGGQTFKISGTAVSGGTINQLMPFVTGAIKYTKRPAFLNGFCKYLPQSTGGSLDVSNIQVFFFKWNGTSRDTIGKGQLSPTNTTFAAFSVPITFDPLFPVEPDSVQIILASSRGVEAAKNSRLYVDDLAFAVFSQDTIPNFGFESWTGTLPNQPVSWGTANGLHIQLNGCVTQATAAGDFNSGNFGIILNTVQVSSGGQTWRVAGTAVSGGQINQSVPFVSGGVPYALRPTFLRGFCKYLPQQSNALYNGNPVGIDVSNIQVTFTKWNGMTNQRDTIGQGQLSPNNSAYAAFSVPITFTTTATPDTVQIILASSKGIETAQGSKLYVDDLTFDFTVGVEELSLDKFDLKQNFPNPFTGSTSIQFNCTANEKVIFSVFDTLGREAYSNTVSATSGTNTFTYASKLSPGVYFYSISNGSNRVTKRMIVGE